MNGVKMNQDSTQLIIKDENAYKIAQALYNAVTGKTESLSRSYSDNYEVNNEAIVQLYRKIIQTYAQWEVISRNENITIIHIDNSKQVFSSIDRFQAYDKSNASPVESINIAFNVLLGLPNVEKPQPYKILVSITSKIAALHKANSSNTTNMLYRLFRGQIITVKIEHIDSIVARNMLSTVDSWISEIEINKKNEFIKFLQRKSHWFAVISSILMFFISVCACYYLIGATKMDFTIDVNILKYLISTLGIVGMFYLIGAVLGKLLENSIDKIDELSYINLNNGDKKILASAKSKLNWNYLRSIGWFVILTLQAIFASTIANWILP